ncbi:MAG: hypothetical protein HQK77_12125 [Desulfobacterales bacterium]|nr:hypothetical protein [Desulfobacterales bacterium]
MIPNDWVIEVGRNNLSPVHGFHLADNFSNALVYNKLKNATTLLVFLTAPECTRILFKGSFITALFFTHPANSQHHQEHLKEH